MHTLRFLSASIVIYLLFCLYEVRCFCSKSCCCLAKGVVVVFPYLVVALLAEVDAVVVAGHGMSSAAPTSF